MFRMFPIISQVTETPGNIVVIKNKKKIAQSSLQRQMFLTKTIENKFHLKTIET